MLKRLRVHIVPFGYEVRRVIDPLIEYDAHKVYLIGHHANDAKAEGYHKEIARELSKYPAIRVIDESVDMWDLFSCMEKFRSIILKEIGNEIYVNVSTGSKITAIAGMLSCMIWNGSAEPYYAHASVMDVHKSVEAINALPVCAISRPKDQELVVLRTLDQNGKRLRKWRLIQLLVDQKVIRQKEEVSEKGNAKEFTLAAKHSQLRAVLMPMELSEHIRIEGTGKRSEVVLLQQGKDTLRIFGDARTGGQE